MRRVNEATPRARRHLEANATRHYRNQASTGLRKLEGGMKTWIDTLPPDSSMTRLPLEVMRIVDASASDSGTEQVVITHEGKILSGTGREVPTNE